MWSCRTEMWNQLSKKKSPVLSFHEPTIFFRFFPELRHIFKIIPSTIRLIQRTHVETKMQKRIVKLSTLLYIAAGQCIKYGTHSNSVSTYFFLFKTIMQHTIISLPRFPFPFNNCSLSRIIFSQVYISFRALLHRAYELYGHYWQVSSSK